jgi:recombination protein RecA
VEKSGAWYAFGSERLGQGKENVRQMLQENTTLREAIEQKLLEHLGMREPVQSADEAEKQD